MAVCRVRARFKELVFSFLLLKMNFKWFPSTTSPRTLTLFLVFFSCSAVEGKRYIIGSSQPITAVLGEDVILPCHLYPPYDVQTYALEWLRPDFKMRQQRFVHLHRDGQEVLHNKIQSYISRTKLFTDDLRQGNMSLKIMNVTSTDEGTYRCFIPKLGVDSIIQLVVAPNVTTWTTQTPLNPTNLPTPQDGARDDVARNIYVITGVSSVFLLILASVVGYFIKRHKKKQDGVPIKRPPHMVPCLGEHR